MPTSDPRDPKRLPPEEVKAAFDQLRQLVELARNDREGLDRELERMFPGAKAKKDQSPSQP
jgi:hypothetical protein